MKCKKLNMRAIKGGKKDDLPRTKKINSLFVGFTPCFPLISVVRISMAQERQKKKHQNVYNGNGYLVCRQGGKLLCHKYPPYDTGIEGQLVDSNESSSLLSFYGIKCSNRALVSKVEIIEGFYCICSNFHEVHGSF